MKEFWIYTAARLGVFLVTYAAIVGIYLVATGDDQVPLIWPFLVAVVVSAVASMTLLRKQRDAFAGAVQRRAEQSAQRRRVVAAEQERMSAEQESTSADQEPTSAEQRSEDEPGR